MDQLPRGAALTGGARLAGAVFIAVLAGAAAVEGQTAGQQPAPAASPTTAISAPSPTPPAPVTPPLSVRLEPGGSLRVESGSTPPWWSYWVPTVGPIISGALAFLGAWLGLSIAQRNTLRTIEAAQRTAEASVWQKANETELKDLLGKLDGFYGPFMQMSEANRLMAEDVRSRQPEGHRLLLKVFDREWLQSLSPGDRTIVAEICKNAAVLERFIAEKAGMVDGQVLPYLARASAHFRVLHLAHEGKLGADPIQFARYVFPKSLDGVLTLEVHRLKRRCDRLRAEPSEAPGPMEALKLRPELALEPWSTIDLQVDEPEL